MRKPKKRDTHARRMCILEREPFRSISLLSNSHFSAFWRVLAKRSVMSFLHDIGGGNRPDIPPTSPGLNVLSRGYKGHSVKTRRTVVQKNFPQFFALKKSPLPFLLCFLKLSYYL